MCEPHFPHFPHQRSNPSDEELCSLTASVLRLCGETRRATKMYEAAVAHSPSSIPLQRALFFQYVAVGDFKAQQTVRGPFLCAVSRA